MQVEIIRRLEDIDNKDLVELSSQSNYKEFNELFNSIKDKFSEVKEMIDDFVFQGGDIHVEERYNLARTKFRSVSLSTKRSIDLSGKGDELIDEKDKRYNDDSELTSSLMKTTSLLKSNLDQSIVNHQIWEDSSSLINTTLNQYMDFNGLLNGSKQLLRQLERGNVLDKLLIFISILFFLFCVLFVLKRRVYNKGMSLISLLFKPFQIQYSTEHSEL